MEDLIRKFFYTGVGLVSLTAERLQDSVKKLVDEEKISYDQGRKLIDEIMERVGSKREEFERNFKKASEDLAVKFKSSTESKSSELERRIEALEAKLGMKDEKPATLVKKAPARKRTVKSRAKENIDAIADTAEDVLKGTAKKVDETSKAVSKKTKAVTKKASSTVKKARKNAKGLVDDAAKTVDDLSKKGEETVAKTQRKRSTAKAKA